MTWTCQREVNDGKWKLSSLSTSGKWDKKKILWANIWWTKGMAHMSVLYLLKIVLMLLFVRQKRSVFFSICKKFRSSGMKIKLWNVSHARLSYFLNLWGLLLAFMKPWEWPPKTKNKKSSRESDKFQHILSARSYLVLDGRWHYLAWCPLWLMFLTQ